MTDLAAKYSVTKNGEGMVLDSMLLVQVGSPEVHRSGG